MIPGTLLRSREVSWSCRGWAALPAMLLTMLLGGVARAQLLLPSAVAADGQRNVYVAETNRHEVVRIDPQGAVTVVAGTGVQGFGGDGGPATAAELDSPAGVAIVGGVLYIADTRNQRVRAVDATGVIATIAGDGVRGFGGDGELATAAELDGPSALAVDAAGTLYIADVGNERVRRVSGGVITTVAGNGVQGFRGDGGLATAAELDGPGGLAVSGGVLYVADTRNQRIRAVDAAGTIRTVAGTGVNGFSGEGGAAVDAMLARPRGVGVDAAGNVVFADSNNQRVRMISPAGVITTLAGSGVQGAFAEGTGATAAGLNTPDAAVAATGKVVVADTGNNRVEEIVQGGVYPVGGAGGGGLATVTVGLSAPGTFAYGGGSAVVSLAGGGGAASGTVELLDGGAVTASAAVVGGRANFSLAVLEAGVHSLTARYGGDAAHAAGVSAAQAVTILPLTITALAEAEAVQYGAAVPAATGSLSGVLAGDTGRVMASFSSAAAKGSEVGMYPIAASLSGPAAGNYSVAMGAGSGAVTIIPAATVSVVQPPAGTLYAGQSTEWTAEVSSSTGAVPAGSVSFYDGGTLLGTEVLAGGFATLSTAALGVATHAITAAYAGDADFAASRSPVLNASVVGAPDFTLALAGAGTAVVGPGAKATFALELSSLGGAFAAPVRFAATGLPPGAVASFSPVEVVPGAGLVGVTLTVQTAVSSGHAARGLPLLAFVVLLPLLRVRRRMAAGMVVLVAGLCAGGCSDRTLTILPTTNQYAITVTGSAVSVTNTLLQHAVAVSLTVQ